MVTKPGEDVADVSVTRRAVRSFCASDTFSLNLFSDRGRAGCKGTASCEGTVGATYGYCAGDEVVGVGTFVPCCDTGALCPCCAAGDDGCCVPVVVCCAGVRCGDAGVCAALGAGVVGVGCDCCEALTTRGRVKVGSVFSDAISKDANANTT